MSKKTRKRNYFLNDTTNSLLLSNFVSFFTQTFVLSCHEDKQLFVILPWTTKRKKLLEKVHVKGNPRWEKRICLRNVWRDETCLQGRKKFSTLISFLPFFQWEGRTLISFFSIQFHPFIFSLPSSYSPSSWAVDEDTVAEMKSTPWCFVKGESHANLHLDLGK